MPSITDPTKYPWYTVPGNSFNPFVNVTITPDYLGQLITEAVQLNDDDLGAISDPVNPNQGNGSYPYGFSENIYAADLSDPTTLVHRLAFTPPTLSPGQSAEATAPLYAYTPYYPYYNSFGADYNPIIDTVTAPLITGTASNQPVSADGSPGTIKPFATVSITDTDFNNASQDTAKIIITYGGVPTDATGQLTGPGLSQTGVGTYALSSPTHTLAQELQNLTLTVPSFVGIRTPHIELDVTDVPPSGALAAPGFDPATALTSKDTTTSVREIGTPITASVSGTAQEGQTLTAASNDSSVTFQWQRSVDGNAWSDISGATGGTYIVSEADENDVLRVNATDIEQTNPSAATAKVVDVTPKLTVAISGTPQEGQTLLATPNLVTDADQDAGDITYQWQRSNDAGKTWDNIDGATASSYKLGAADDNDLVRSELSFTDDTKQSVVADSDPLKVGPDNGGGVNHFHIVDNTTGMSFDTPGDPYNGPVPGIEWQYIVPADIITHNLNISAMTGNVFIHGGSGDDALDMNGHEGRDVLDGSTGSNFLTGDPLNAPGDSNGVYDEFFVDDRNPSANIWTTVRGMDAPDKATIWGLTQQDFAKMTEGNDVLPIAPGLDFSLIRPGQPDVNLTLSDYHISDLPQSMGGNGRLSISFGHTPDLPNLPGSDYMQIMANS